MSQVFSFLFKSEKSCSGWYPSPPQKGVSVSRQDKLGLFLTSHGGNSLLQNIVQDGNIKTSETVSEFQGLCLEHLRRRSCLVTIRNLYTGFKTPFRFQKGNKNVQYSIQ